MSKRFKRFLKEAEFDFNDNETDSIEELTPTKRLSYVIHSLIEELEAIDVYNERLVNCKDVKLKRVLEHNRDEEAEHASLLIAQLARIYPKFAEMLVKAFEKEDT